jgi:hypothetical protein
MTTKEYLETKELPASMSYSELDRIAVDLYVEYKIEREIAFKDAIRRAWLEGYEHLERLERLNRKRL